MQSQMKSLFKKLRGSRELSLFLVLAILCIAVQLRNDAFLTSKTINDMLVITSYSIHYTKLYDVYVMCDGRVTGELSRSVASQEVILELAMAKHTHHAHAQGV